MLSSLKAPKLKLLDLSNNLLTASDLLKLDNESFPNLAALILYPSLTEKENKEIYQHLNKYRTGKDPRILIAAQI